MKCAVELSNKWMSAAFVTQRCQHMLLAHGSIELLVSNYEIFLYNLKQLIQETTKSSKRENYSRVKTHLNGLCLSSF